MKEPQITKWRCKKTGAIYDSDMLFLNDYYDGGANSFHTLVTLLLENYELLETANSGVMLKCVGLYDFGNLQAENAYLYKKIGVMLDKEKYYEDILKMANDNYDELLARNGTPSYMIPIYILVGFVMTLLAYGFIR